MADMHDRNLNNKEMALQNPCFSYNSLWVCHWQQPHFHILSCHPRKSYHTFPPAPQTSFQKSKKQALSLRSLFHLFQFTLLLATCMTYTRCVIRLVGFKPIKMFIHSSIHLVIQHILNRLCVPFSWPRKRLLKTYLPSCKSQSRQKRILTYKWQILL